MITSLGNHEIQKNFLTTHLNQESQTQMSLELSRKHKVVTWSKMRESSRLWQTGMHANQNTFQILKYYTY